ncbi:transposase [uncultured Parasutterella sp.]|uniref:transposase n=1 Tax=uncultured Parasutterella sp. TaxID=1263098 RepID=UPI003390045F
MVTHAQTTQKVLNKITKTLEELAKNDKVCQLIQTIPGLGPICSCRLRATIGDIRRFSCLLWLGTEKHCYGAQREERKITHRGDKTMRSLMVQGAGCVVIMATKGTLGSK